MIDIILPVLNRPANAEKVSRSISENTLCDHTLTFICSPGDEAEIDAVRATGFDYIVTDWQPGPGDGAKKWNLGYRHTEYPFVFTAADDLEFTYGWDEKALEVAERSNAGVTGTNDCSNPLVKRGLHSTHSLVSRRYIDEVGGTWHDGPGLIYCEAYAHQWVDTELCAAAKQRGEWAFAVQSKVIHHHPIYDRSVEYDDTYRKALSDAKEDSAMFKERQRRAIVNP